MLLDKGEFLVWTYDLYNENDEKVSLPVMLFEGIREIRSNPW